MKEELKTEYKKRTQKDYNLTMKLQIVRSVEWGEVSVTQAQRKYGIQSRSTVVRWLRKYGSFDWENQTPMNMAKTPEQRILELEQENRLLKKQKKFLEHQVEQKDKKAVLFDMMIDLAEKEYNIDIRKNSEPKWLIYTVYKRKRASHPPVNHLG